MRKVPGYKINVFWEDDTPVENVKDTFSQNQMIKFLVHSTMERINQFPKERREELFYQILQNDYSILYKKIKINTKYTNNIIKL